MTDRTVDDVLLLHAHSPNVWRLRAPYTLKGPIHSKLNCAV